MLNTGEVGRLHQEVAGAPPALAPTARADGFSRVPAHLRLCPHDHGGFPRSELMPYLQARRWVGDFAPLAGLSSREFAERVVSDLLRSGAARWEEDRLVSTVPHRWVTLSQGPRGCRHIG